MKFSDTIGTTNTVAKYSVVFVVVHFRYHDIAKDITSNGAAIVDEAPADGYIPGAHIDCGTFGVGIIKEVDQRGRTKRLLIEFGNGKEFRMNLNVTTMKIIDNPET